MAKIVLLGDVGSHGGTITNSGQAGTVLAESKQVCVYGATYSCPIHGSQTITGGCSLLSFINSKAVALDGALTSCGATITASSTTVFAT